MMLFIMVLTFESVDEIRKCYLLNESYRAALPCGAFGLIPISFFVKFSF